jgi:hypothetical protein
MAAMDRSVAWRAALLQALSVGIVAAVLAAALHRSFFEDWGWLAGPGAWAACAVLVAAVLRLPALRVLAGAAVSGIPSLVTVLAGVHWAGTPLALILFGAWCGWIAARRRPADHVRQGSTSPPSRPGARSAVPPGAPRAMPPGEPPASHPGGPRTSRPAEAG